VQNDAPAFSGGALTANGSNGNGNGAAEGEEGEDSDADKDESPTHDVYPRPVNPQLETRNP